MLKSYFKIAVRNLLINKLYTFINITGLAVGLTCFVMIYIFIRNELNYDTFHENADRIYRPVEVQRNPGIDDQHVAVTMGPLAPALKEEFPEIIEACRINPWGSMFFQFGDKGFYQENVSFADPAVFKIFTIPLLQGHPETALRDPNTVVLNRDIATKFFGQEDPVGKSITIHTGGGISEFKITGVMQNYPRNSHLNLDILISYTTLEPMYEWLKSWYTNTLATYILVRKGTSISDLEKKFPEFIESHRPEDERNSMDLYLQSLKDIHLHSNHILYQTFNHNQGNINTVYTFSIIAVFILLIAAINYMNLSTARSLKRAREVGMRKVFGSSRRSLILQFLSESLLISFLALIFVRLLLEFAFPSVAPLLPDRLIDTYYDTGFFILEMIGITTFIGIIAGSYPAFFLSAFRPATTLKGNFSIGQRGAFLRKVLVVSQFSIAIALIASTGVVKDQLYYIQNKELGYSIDQVVYVPLKNKTTRSKLTLLKNEYLKNSNILSVAGTSGLRGASGSQGTMKVADQDESRMMMRYSFVDFDYIKTMGMTIIRGRDFSKSISSDTLTSVIINQTAIKELGWEDPLGKQFMAGDGEENYTVIGVVNDFHFYTLRQKIEPLIMWLDPDRFRYLIAKIRPENVDRTLEYMQQTWKILLPAFPFEISFLDQHFYEIYLRDRNTGKLFGLFSAVAIFIACLGLLGLAASTVEQKTKEIGIRKVLGASVFGIVSLLAKDFIKWVAFASLIGFPLAYFTMKDWLDNFVYKTGISTFTFLIAALIVLFISLLTVSYQAIKASVTNPVQSLRYE